eukprot:1146266-Rhodomonas_salina.1
MSLTVRLTRSRHNARADGVCRLRSRRLSLRLASVTVPDAVTVFGAQRGPDPRQWHAASSFGDREHTELKYHDARHCDRHGASVTVTVPTQTRNLSKGYARARSLL